MNTIEQKLSEIDHFSKLDRAALIRLTKEAEFTTCDAGETILDPATPRAGFTFLIKGCWWMSRHIVGAETPFEWTDDRPGNWHGGVALFDAVAPAHVKAETQCEVIFVPASLLVELAANDAHLAQAMLRGIQGGATVLYRHATEGSADNAPSGPAKGLTV
ncbi:MAG: cyclic nucleotide-binding domain-containing protein [Pseudomonadota bacterium]